MKKILTIVFDGFGHREDENGNAVKAAQMHNFNSFYNDNPHTTLYASEEHIGLMPGQMGNSEVGHMTIGAGRIIKSNKTMIEEFFNSDISQNESFIDLIADSDRKVHIMGLCSDGNVHASVDNFISMHELLCKCGMKKIYFHLITDGRDTKVDVAYKFIKKIESSIKKLGVGSISTVCGRYYAMDRDQNYQRTKLYYDLVTKGIGISVLNIESSLNASYQKEITDEFIKPIIIDDAGLIKDGDAIVWMNFRADRAKQILSTFCNSKFDEFEVKPFDNGDVYTFFKVDKNIKTSVFIPNDGVENPLGIYLSKLGLKQARVAESEKFPHVTYFFDGGFNGKIENCDKFHIPSPDVATYDLKPEMSAIGVTKKIIECIEKDYDFIFANFANPDMVGHTGNFEATAKACMALDICLSRILESAEENFYTVILLADHGNADTMFNKDGSICTTHSLEKVPFVINDPKVVLKEDGNLSNVAATILDYMDISIPLQMESESLIVKE